jgi:nucleotide-binding universal stress UspA family protein
MLKSVLLYLDEPAQAECVIRVGVNAARATQARVRGLTLVDTRWIAAVNQCESAASAVMAHEQCEVMKRDGAIVRKALSRECLNAGLNFDVRNIAGDPVEVLSREAHYHDLVVTSVTRGGSLSLAGTLGLVEHGVQPLLVVRPEQTSLERVLLVYDGSEASGRAIRSFLGLNILRDADHRLLAVGRDADAARAALCEMGDYCHGRRERLETGCVAGRSRQVIVPYAEKWQADLLVLGAGGWSRALRRVGNDPATWAWNKLKCAVLTAA